MQQDLAEIEADDKIEIGFGAAVGQRKAAMESKGLQTETVAPDSKEAKKAEREKRKQLTGAKHLLK